MGISGKRFPDSRRALAGALLIAGLVAAAGRGAAASSQARAMGVVWTGLTARPAPPR